MKVIFIQILVISLVGVQTIKAQETISAGARHKIFSKALKEEREYWIYMPKLNPDKKYPILYLLDGDTFYHTVVGITGLLASSKVSSLEPCIVVAVLNTDRERDMTPTSSAAQRDGTINPHDQPHGGGAEAFHSFLIKELRPMVEKQTPANGQNILVGHSYAGLFSLHVLLNHPESFDAYLAIDPSLWWDRGYIMNQAKNFQSQQQFNNKKLYVAFATKPRPGKKLINTSLLDTFEDAVVPIMEQKKLQTITRRFPQETHGTIAIPGIYDGLKSLYFIRDADR